MHTAGELFYFFLQMAWAVYRQLAAMKVLPQITAGARVIATPALLWCALSAGLVLLSHTLVQQRVTGRCAQAGEAFS